MERNVKLIIAYDGSDFSGWQTQAGQRTVQQEIEHVLIRTLRHPVSLAGASRTDAGVHARGQSASFRTSCVIPTENLRRALAGRLPPDVTIVHAAEVPPTFHASRDALGKLYRYTLYASQHAPAEELAARYAWHVWHPLDLDRMRRAAAAFIGSHDFAGFANQGSPRETTVRTINRVGIWRRGRRVHIDVEGERFLYNQVRIMVGTLVEIGRGHWPPERVASVLASRDRSQAGQTAPPQGLCLQWVCYPAQRSIADGA
jgi:tRNA pseudouridine38-40 synthase